VSFSEKGSLITDVAPSGELLLGTETLEERKEREKKYREEVLNEDDQGGSQASQDNIE
jgi:hypothetical protein